MRCEQCGAEVAKGESFCRVCGARVKAAEPEHKLEEQSKPDAPEREPDKQKKQNKQKPAEGRERRRLLIVAVAGIVIAAVAVVLTIVLANIGKSPMMERDADRPFYAVMDGVAGAEDVCVLYSADGTALAASTETWQVSESVWNGTVALVDNRGVLSVATADGCSDALPPNVYRAWVCADGSKVAFISDYDENTGDGGNLYVYDVKKGESTLIDTMVSAVADATLPFGDAPGVTLSPGGDVVCYTAYDEASDAYHVRMSKNSKKGERILDCQWVFAVSDDGQYIYFLNNDRYYIMTGGERTRLFEVSSLYLPVSLNADCTELMCFVPDGCHIYKNGVEEYHVRTGAGLRGPVAVKGMWQSDWADVLPVRTFYGMVCDLCSDIYFLWEDECELIANDHVDAAASLDGRKLVYIDEFGKIMQVKKLEPGCQPELVASPDERPTALYADPKLTGVYFTNERGELWHVRGKKLTMVSADVSDVCMGGDGRLYFVYDGVVLCRADGSERVSVERREGIVSVNAVPRGVTVETTRDGTFYYKDGGDAVKLPVSVAQAKEEK